MIKYESSRTAVCPYCGRTVTYHTRAEKRRYAASGGSAYNHISGDFSGCAAILGIGALIVIGLPLVILTLIFGDSFWDLLGNMFGFLFDLLWYIIKFILDGIWAFISGIFDLIF